MRVHRGLRAQRVGEASKPGPSSGHASPPPRGLRVLSFNINSPMKHRNELLCRAQEHDADVLLVQESGTTEQQLPGMSSFLKRQGWQMMASSAKSLPQGGKGGMAVLAREPLALSPAKEVILDSEQMLFCNLHGASIASGVGFRV